VIRPVADPRVLAPQNKQPSSAKVSRESPCGRLLDAAHWVSPILQVSPLVKSRAKVRAHRLLPSSRFLLILYHYRPPRCSSQSFCSCQKPHLDHTTPSRRRPRKRVPTITSISLHIRPCRGSPSIHNVTPDDLGSVDPLTPACGLHLRLQESAGAMASTARNNPHNELMSALSTSVSSHAFHLSIP